MTIGNQIRAAFSSSFIFPTGTGTAGTTFRPNVNAQLVPEPGSALLLAVAGAGLLLRRRRRGLRATGAR